MNTLDCPLQKCSSIIDAEWFGADNAVSLFSINYLNKKVVDFSCCRSVSIALKNQELLEQEKEFVFENNKRGFTLEIMAKVFKSG